VERGDFLLVWALVGAVAIVVSLLGGSDIVSSLVSGAFIGFLVALLIHMGLNKLHE
jgi:hypothetical protein